MNAHTRLKPPPPGFAETYVRWGWRGVENAHGGRTACNKRWIGELDPQVREERAEYARRWKARECESMDRLTHQIIEAKCTRDRLIIVLADGREISTPLHWFPALNQSTPESRGSVRITSDGLAVEWPSLKERVSVKYVLALGASDLPLWGGQ